MREQFIRTQLLLGSEGMEILAEKRVAVFGIGGVGGYASEALARSGVGAIDLIDDDRICESNINRQIIALHSTLGRYKTDVMEERIRDINPHCRVTSHHCFYLPETAQEFDFREYDYILDAVDTVSAKLGLAEEAKGAGTPIISSMGAGNKMDPSLFQVGDIYETSVCPLARVMRRELKKRGIEALKVVYSTEIPREPLSPPQAESVFRASKKRQTPGSLSFVPPVAGLIMAGEVIKDLLNQGKNLQKSVFNPLKSGEVY